MKTEFFKVFTAADGYDRKLVIGVSWVPRVNGCCELVLEHFHVPSDYMGGTLSGYKHKTFLGSAGHKRFLDLSGGYFPVFEYIDGLVSDFENESEKWLSENAKFVGAFESMGFE